MRGRWLIAAGLMMAVTAGCAAGAATKKMDESIRAGTDMGLDDMTKARDVSVESQIMQGIASDPNLFNIKDKIQITVSHNVVTITGRVRTEEQKVAIEDIVKHSVKTANVKEYELDLEIDPNIEELPFDEL